MVYDIDKDFDSIPDGTKEIFLPEFEKEGEMGPPFKIFQFPPFH